MILTCPECATSYFVDDERIPLTGRRVKCANCGARWTATLDPPPTDLDPNEVSPELAAVIAPQVVAEPVPQDEPVLVEAENTFGDVEVEPAAVEAPAPRPRRPPAISQPPAKTGLSVSLIALTVLAVVALVLAAVVLLRGPIARKAPALAPVFEALGMKAQTTDLLIEGVHSQAAFQGETPVLTVTGAVRNWGLETHEAPPIRVRLRDRAGKIVAVRTATPVDGAVPPAATRYFAIIVPNPPSTASDLDIDFTNGSPAAKEPASGHAASAKVEHAEPAPAEARPAPEHHD